LKTEGAISRRHLLDPAEVTNGSSGGAEMASHIFQQLGRDGRVGFQIKASGNKQTK